MEWLTASTESSVNFTPLQDLDGIVTPNGLCFERHHGGVPEVIPADYRLMINGLVDHELIFTLDDLKRFPKLIGFISLNVRRMEEWSGEEHSSMVANTPSAWCTMSSIAELGCRISAVRLGSSHLQNGSLLRVEIGWYEPSVPIEKILMIV